MCLQVSYRVTHFVPLICFYQFKNYKGSYYGLISARLRGQVNFLLSRTEGLWRTPDRNLDVNHLWDLILRSPSSDTVINYSLIFSNPIGRMAKTHFYFTVLQTLRCLLHCWSQESSFPLSNLQRPSFWEGWCTAANSSFRKRVRVPCWQDRERFSGSLLREKYSDVRMGKGKRTYKMCPNQGSQRNCNHIGKCTLLLTKLHQENTISTIFCWTRFLLHWAREYLQCQWDGGSWVQTSTPLHQTTSVASLCSKGSFSSLSYGVNITQSA